MGYYHDKLIDEIRARGFSQSTEKSYATTIRKFITFSKVSPARLTINHAKKFKLHLINNQKRAPATVNAQVAAIRFFFNHVIQKRFDEKDFTFVKRYRKLPDVLSKNDVIKILNAIENIKHRAMFMGIYSCGLRKSEVMTLKSSDIDSDRMLIKIRCSKGRKDRFVPLSPLFLRYLRKYWQEVEINRRHLLFPSNHPRKVYNPKTLNEILDSAAERAGIKKKVSVHTLRHSYATHSLEDGLNLRYIQLFLGHDRIDSTAIYTHLVDYNKANIKSPLDSIEKDLLR